jgi:hypothetical protein
MIMFSSTSNLVSASMPSDYVLLSSTSRDSLLEVNEANTCSLFLPASLLISLRICLLTPLMSHSMQVWKHHTTSSLVSLWPLGWDARPPLLGPPMLRPHSLKINDTSPQHPCLRPDLFVCNIG